MNLRMNHIGDMNDPKENLYHIVYENDFVEIKGGKKEFNFDEYLLAEKIRKETRIISFSTDKEVFTETNKIKDYGYQFQRMWANYGQNHEGICLEIDYDDFINENKRNIEDFKIIDKKK